MLFGFTQTASSPRLELICSRPAIRTIWSTGHQQPGHAEGVITLGIWASLGNQGADQSEGLQCACTQAGAPFSCSVPSALCTKKLHVVVSAEMLNKIVSIMAVHILKGEFEVGSH